MDSTTFFFFCEVALIVVYFWECFVFMIESVMVRIWCLPQRREVGSRNSSGAFFFFWCGSFHILRAMWWREKTHPLTGFTQYFLYSSNISLSSLPVYLASILLLLPVRCYSQLSVCYSILFSSLAILLLRSSALLLLLLLLLLVLSLVFSFRRRFSSCLVCWVFVLICLWPLSHNTCRIAANWSSTFPELLNKCLVGVLYFSHF